MAAPSASSKRLVDGGFEVERVDLQELDIAARHAGRPAWLVVQDSPVAEA
jgi:hypothetical protein